MTHKLNSILLIDDDDISNLVARMALEEVNCALDINTKQSATEALEHIVNCADKLGKVNSLPFPDLILLDISMPVMNGWEFITEYKKLVNTFWHNPIIIMISSCFDHGNRLKAASVPEVSGIYAKPITAEIITEVFVKHFPDYV